MTKNDQIKVLDDYIKMLNFINAVIALLCAVHRLQQCANHQNSSASVNI